MTSREFAAASPFHGVVHLRSLPLEPEVSETRLRYLDEFGDDPESRGGWYHDDDWQRISFVLRCLRPGQRFLDVGCGAGQFVNAVVRTNRFAEVYATDIARFSKYREYEEGIQRGFDSVHALPFADDYFDVVTCMEVLEHVDDEIFEPAIKELQRVCRGQLLVSVPYQEPEPIYSGHKRRFEPEDIFSTFPNWDRVLLDRPRMPWAMSERWCGAGSQVSAMRLTASELPSERIQAAKTVAPTLPANPAAMLRSQLRRLRSRLR